MKEEISEALLDFYGKILAPEFSEIKKVQSEHGERFIDVLGHFDSVYKRFDRLEDEYHMITHDLKRITVEGASQSKSVASLQQLLGEQLRKQGSDK